MPTVLVTGANRGLGLHFVRHYAAQGWRVVAGARDPDRSDALRAVAGDIHIRPLDVTDDASVALLAAEMARAPLDLLVNNAGLLGPRNGTSVDDDGRGQGLDDIDFGAWMEVLAVNTLAPLRVARAFLGALGQASRPVLLTLSSGMGSIARVRYGGWYAYRSSKAAVNMVTRILAHDLEPHGIIAVVMHPGWAQTDMGGSGATLPPARSVEAMARVVAGLSLADTGRFLNHDGTELPW